MKQFKFFPLIPLSHHSNAMYMTMRMVKHQIRVQNGIQTDSEKRFFDLVVLTHTN